MSSSRIFWSSCGFSGLIESWFFFLQGDFLCWALDCLVFAEKRPLISCGKVWFPLLLPNNFQGCLGFLPFGSMGLSAVWTFLCFFGGAFLRLPRAPLDCFVEFSGGWVHGNPILEGSGLMAVSDAGFSMPSSLLCGLALPDRVIFHGSASLDCLVFAEIRGYRRKVRCRFNCCLQGRLPRGAWYLPAVWVPWRSSAFYSLLCFSIGDFLRLPRAPMD